MWEGTAQSPATWKRQVFKAHAIPGGCLTADTIDHACPQGPASFKLILEFCNASEVSFGSSRRKEASKLASD